MANVDPPHLGLQYTNTLYINIMNNKIINNIMIVINIILFSV